MTGRSRRARVRTLIVSGALFVCYASSVTAGDTERWQALFAAVPPPPTSPADALSRIAVHRVGSQVGIDVTDPTLHKFQRDVDALFQQPSTESAAIIQQRLRAVEDDPKLRKLSREINAVLGLESGASTPPTSEQLLALNAEVNRVLGEGATTRDRGPGSEIAAYRLELQRMQPRAGRAYQRLFEQQRRYWQLHADLDRAALAQLAAERANGATGGIVATARELVERHHALARQQLVEVGTLFSEARAASAPAFDHMARLALDAERRDAPPTERVQAYALFKAHIEQLLTISRFAVEDVGFWAGVRVPMSPGIATSGPIGSLYEFALAPDVDMHASGEAPPGGPYPSGRERKAVGPPGIR